MDLKDNLEREVSSSELCDLMGGKFDVGKSACVFLDEEDLYDRSVIEPKYATYYISQILIGAALTFFGVFFGVTIVPPFWYVNLIILVFASICFIFSDWFREGEIKESLLRFCLLFPLFAVLAIVITTLIEFGTPIHGKYWSLLYFTTDPVIATINALFVAALLNVFLLPKAELIQIIK